MKIDFHSTDPQHIANLGDLKQYYQKDDPGYPYITQRPVIYNQFAASHLTDEGHQLRVRWLETYEDDLMRAFINPDFIEKLCRKRNDGHYSITLITELRPGSRKEGRFLTVAVSLSLEPVGGYHQITTIHPSKWTDLYYANGNLKGKYLRLK